jgi:hypothetical protein
MQDTLQPDANVDVYVRGRTKRREDVAADQNVIPERAVVWGCPLGTENKSTASIEPGVSTTGRDPSPLSTPPIPHE